MTRLAPLSFALVAAVAGCGSPNLVVRNFDPTQPKAEIWIDGRRVGALAYKEDLSVSLPTGLHRIKAVPPGVTNSPWHPDVEACEVVVEDDAVMTLVTPGAR